MSGIEHHITTLQTRHADLEKRLHQEQTRPMPDDAVIRTLKHEKLALKDEIQRLETAKP